MTDEESRNRLPRVSKETILSLVAERKDRANQGRLEERKMSLLEEMSEENPVLLRGIYAIAEQVPSEDGRGYFIEGALTVYDLLRNQAISNNLREESYGD